VSTFLEALVLLPVGLVVGLVGSLIGVGGGFFVVPLLMIGYKYPKESATAASLGCVLLSAVSGTMANAKRKRIDYRTAMVLAAGTLPGAWYGRFVIGKLTSQQFSISFGALLLGIAAYVLFVRLKSGKGLVRGAPRELTDSEGQVHRFEANLPLGFAVSLGIGVISSLFGIGGGLILVPFLVIAYGMPPICSAAAAQFTFMFASAMSLAISIAKGQMTPEGWRAIGLLGGGVVVGAQLGVSLAKKLPERLFRTLLVAVIVFVSVTMIRQGIRP
jgi:uncharacterized membrane protein YfcA